MSNPEIIQNFIKGFTAETTPGGAAKIPDFREHLREGTVVYITFLPGSDFNDTVDVAVRLRKEGFIPVPHFAARSITNEKVLEENIKRVVGEAGVDWVLTIAGAVDKPLGDFSDSMQLLQTGLFQKHGINKIAVAGHPEGSPDMPDSAILDAMRWKNAYAKETGTDMYMVTQFAFDVDPIIQWDKFLQSEGNELPIHIGVPGLATLKSLLMHAKHCGVGPSMKVLTKQAKNLTKLLVVNAPDKQVADLANYQATDPNCGITGVHMYPLGGLRRTAEWSYEVADGRIVMNKKGGFDTINKIS
ncbi:methylenetetrahydrofolate reductase [Aliamphritea spongicola]|uniref:methylenetetrahydrofolate reductase n=1 Tax=Aliamphritea spongicola TaxID=707589 RepID=UPI00196ADD7B|nr:methylenetetrahydrofolate reductase [Aliamphritea spongicola]MBN3561112.1 methylenetetrahydrofolate reductase [Aliamphritea spongicola]